MILLQNYRTRGILWIWYTVVIGVVLISFHFAFTSELVQDHISIPGIGNANHNSVSCRTKSSNFPQVIADLWQPLIHPIHDPVFSTNTGEKFKVSYKSRRWMQPLRKRVVIIDTDTRLDEEKEGSLLHQGPLEYNRLPGQTGGHLNHYIYALIHGYDYRLIRAPNYPDRHGTWVKPAMIKEALKTHDFVVSLDSDAVFTHLELPLEWLMNLWDFTPETLVAMAEDLDNDLDHDSHGKLILNTGFVIAQAGKRSQEMMAMWEDCPNRIQGCDKWRMKWAHEQSAFSGYIRYEFNETNMVKNIPCNHANGNVYYEDGKGACQGVFVSHNWHSKDKTVEILQKSVMQAIVQRLHTQFQADKEELFVDGSESTYPIENLHI